MVKNRIIPLAAAVLVMCAVSGLLLLALSCAVFYMELPANVIDIGITAIYIIAGFSGGILVGKLCREKKYMWGVVAGSVFFALLLAVSLVCSAGRIADVVHVLSVLVFCVLSSMIGGMVS